MLDYSFQCSNWSSSMQVELPGGGGVRRRMGGGVRRGLHAAATVRSDNTVHVIEFGGMDESVTMLACTTVMQMSEYTHHVHVHVLTCSFV